VRKSLIDSITPFTGDSFDFQQLNEFWIQFNKLFTKKPFDGQQEIDLISAKLKGPALVWFSAINPTPKCWFELKPLLVQRFTNCEYVRLTLAKLNAIA
jgi:hypothetical protein